MHGDTVIQPCGCQMQLLTHPIYRDLELIWRKCLRHSDSETLPADKVNPNPFAALTGYGDPRFYALLQGMAETHSKKNQDYAQGGKQGHLGNFIRVSEFKKLYPGFDWTTPFGVAISFMLKQLDAAMILAATSRESITGEPVEERLKDVVIYGNIASILWTEMKKALRQQEQATSVHDERLQQADRSSEAKDKTLR